MDGMTAPLRIVIDRLVLHGVTDSDAHAVVAAFQRYLAEFVRNPSLRPPDESGTQNEKHGHLLAAAVARSVRRTGVT